MKSSISTLPFILHICFTILSSGTIAQDPCAPINKAFTDPDSEKPICQCIVNPTSISTLASNMNSTSSKEDNEFWIGCTRQKMPALYRSLFAMNDTKIMHFHIWDSLIPIIPNEMFSKIRPEKLTIENSRVGVLRNEAFANIGESLKELSLRNNILKDFEDKILTNLTKLTMLDLRGNKLAEIKSVQISQLNKLEKLMLNGNQLSSLKDGLFQTFGNLKMLNLANNRLKRITNETFKGLTKLEVLILRGNRIESIDEDAFSHLKSLKILDLWHNKIDKVKVRGHPKLERIILANNSIINLADIKLEDLPSLTNLHLEDNKISMIDDIDLIGLKGSEKLISLTADGNNISWIGCNAFEPVPNLLVLSLQRNKITSLSCSSTRDPKSSFVYLDRSVLEPLKLLRRLLLSHNEITLVNDEDLASLSSLRDLALDHNRIIKIGRNSFQELKLSKLFLNNNRLYYLPKGIFDGLTPPDLQIVDISLNNWECICEQEWIGDWLAGLGSVNSNSGSLGCLVGKCQEAEPGTSNTIYDDEQEWHEFWIKVAAFILAFVAILLLIIAGYFYMQEGLHNLPLRRFNSDTIRLIPSQESLYSFPNPIIGSNEMAKSSPPPTTTTIISPLSIRTSMTKSTAAIKTEEDGDVKKDRKKVRFND